MLDIGVLIVIIYSIVETLEKFGMNQKTVHLLAIPLGLMSSFLFLQGNFEQLVLQGLLIGFGSAGVCDTSNNVLNWVKSKLLNS
ncbi:hypothetical protein Desaci_0312 [Desulfosporosinus acidiphilus SJ4]|uniref:Holin n=1 Tax=Desulfosporosinus acidiphilus (strain DSM 22704 / JCM 16185 / SJ4) TaxID=646529 RepID=I4D0R0_DESAJ|nr:hypothetical protein [Desulfosporosinus acidiphilus]AFM39384.1 hypothetical protein Desaci_0312 [Desulfosporosinus acidiphilus SJ4]